MSTQFREPRLAKLIYAIDNCPGTQLPKRKCADCPTLLNHRKADELIALAHDGRGETKLKNYIELLRKAR